MHDDVPTYNILKFVVLKLNNNILNNNDRKKQTNRTVKYDVDNKLFQIYVLTFLCDICNCTIKNNQF